jgi:uncharacterized membrane protein YeaQ/YmgE (transglycosylase-associated protein family)
MRIEERLVGGSAMELVVWLVGGVVAGTLAMLAVFRTFPRSPTSWVGALLAGLAGGWLGGFVAELIGLEAVNWLGALVVAFLGTFVILFALRRLLPSRV